MKIQKPSTDYTDSFIGNLCNLWIKILLVVIVSPGLCAAQQVVDKMVATVNAGVKTDLITYSDLLWQLSLQPGTVLDNLAVADPGRTHDPAVVLGRVGLAPEMLDRRADDLSGGEAQRMCIARALLTDPEVLLLDEPTSALDVDARVHIEQLVVDLVHDGLGALWVTHDLDQAERLISRCGGRIVVLLDGRVASDAVARRSLAARTFATRSMPAEPADDGGGDR